MDDMASSRQADTPHRDATQPHPQARMLRLWALIVLVPVAVIGAALSFQSLYLAAVPVFGPQLALGFPLLVDFLILGASLQYVAGAKVGRPRAGWRWTAHAGVVGTLFLNAMAANGLREVPWHITAPAVWSVLVELSAREVLGQWRAVHAPLQDRIPLRLWLTAPIESGRTWLRVARRLDGEQASARLDVGVHAAAVEALKLTLPHRRARRARRILQRQLRAGSLPPAAILGPLGWLDDSQALTEITPHTVLRAALRDTLRGQAPQQPLPPDVDTAPVVAPEPAVPPRPEAESPPEPQPQPGPRRRPSGKAKTTRSGPIPQRQVEAVFQSPAPLPDQPVIDLTEPEPTAAAVPPSKRNAAAPHTGNDQVSTGDRFADAVEIVRVHESISATQLATQLRGLDWQVSDRTAGRILVEVREHLRQHDPWALPTP